MSTIKTLVSDKSVNAFIDTVPDATKREDSHTLLNIYTQITGEQAKMWGSSIIGFGQYHYASERSSQQGDWPLVGFSPRKQNLTLYFMSGFDSHTELLGQLGTYKTSKSCLYINKLSDVDQTILEKLIAAEYAAMKKAHVVK